MKPQKQTRPHPNGDCIRAAICSLLEISIEDFPDFILTPDDPEADLAPWYVELQTALRLRGYHFLEVQLAQKTMFPHVWDTWAIFIGLHPSSTEEQVIRHAIVGQISGQKLTAVFDPINPDGDPAAAFLHNKVVALCFLVPLDPATMHFADPGNRNPDEPEKLRIITSGNILDFNNPRNGKRI